MSGKIVRHVVDLSNPPPLTDEEQAEISALGALSDNDIDYSDIPALTDQFWKNAIRNPYFKPIKQQLTLRLDADLIAWFKQQRPGGRGYQSAINTALRDYVSAQTRKAG